MGDHSENAGAIHLLGFNFSFCLPKAGKRHHFLLLRFKQVSLCSRVSCLNKSTLLLPFSSNDGKSVCGGMKDVASVAV